MALSLVNHPWHRRLDRQSLGAALNVDCNDASRRVADHRDELAAIDDGLTVHREQAIAGAQSRAPAGAVRRRRMHQRVGMPGGEIKAQAG